MAELSGTDNCRRNLAGQFWEILAKHYPLPYDHELAAATHRVISLAKAKGVKFPGKRILDIGCGTGAYTIPLAEEALEVMGIDLSPAMLEKLREVARERGIGNIELREASWRDLDISSQGLAGRFDIVLSAMSPAIRDEEDIRTMELCSSRWCIYVGWGRIRKNTLMEKVFHAHGLEHSPPQGAAAVFSTLERMGRRPCLDYFDAAWTWEGTIQGAVEELAAFLTMHGAEADFGILREIVKHYAADGLVRHITEVEEGVVIWEAGH
jgi:SAM-dependent methyltransferase